MPPRLLQDVNGILVPGGFGDRVLTARYTPSSMPSEHRIPFLGLCLGMQLSIVEFSQKCDWPQGRNTVLNWIRPPPILVIHLMPEQDGVEDIGGT